MKGSSYIADSRNVEKIVHHARHVHRLPTEYRQRPTRWFIVRRHYGMVNVSECP